MLRQYRIRMAGQAGGCGIYAHAAWDLGLGTHALAARVPSEQTPSSKGSCILLGTVRTIWGEGGGTLRPHTFVEGAHRRPRAPTPVRTSRTAVRYPVHPTLLGNTPAD